MLELRAGEGGEDARIFCRDLARMYQRYCKSTGWQYALLDERLDRAGGARTIVCEIRGRGVSRLHGEAGAHSIQHRTRSRRDDRVHTSTATVAVFDGAALAVQSDVLLRRGDVRIDTFRSSGPGGQHKNASESAVRAVHLASGLVAIACSERSQVQNRARALAVLMTRVQQQADADRARTLSAHRARVGTGGRAQAIRVYDLVRDMVRCASGEKMRGAQRVLDGDLSELLQ